MSFIKVLLLPVLVVSACGFSKKNDKKDAPKMTEEAAKAESATLPQMVIVKVPVDANGKELHEKAEIRLVQKNDQVTESNIATSFEEGTAPKSTIDELDSSSSTESFCGWLWGRRSYYGYSNYNWGYYRPVYTNCGYNYGYNYGGAYGYNYGYGAYNSNYYYYNSGFGNGYSSYGYGSTSTYGGVY